MTLIDQDVDAWLERLHLANTPPLARSRAPALGRAESSHSGELGLIRAGQGANGQVAVTAALWTGGRAWPLGALLYLPAAWTDDTIRRHTHTLSACTGSTIFPSDIESGSECIDPLLDAMTRVEVRRSVTSGRCATRGRSIACREDRPAVRPLPLPLPRTCVSARSVPTPRGRFACLLRTAESSV